MQWFRVDLKTFLGLVMPNQCFQAVRKQISSWFWGDNLGQNLQTFMIPTYGITVLYDTSVLSSKVQQCNIPGATYTKYRSQNLVIIANCNFKKKICINGDKIFTKLFDRPQKCQTTISNCQKSQPDRLYLFLSMSLANCSQAHRELQAA